MQKGFVNCRMPQSHSVYVPAPAAVLHGRSCSAPGWVHQDEGLSELGTNSSLSQDAPREAAAEDKPRNYLQQPSVGAGIP